MAEEEGYELEQPPIISYSNRLQKQMLVITIMLSEQASLSTIVTSLRILLYNFPPEGKKALEKELKKLKDYRKDTSVLDSDVAEAIYSDAHDWAYKEIFEKAFQIKPLSKAKPHIGLKKDE